MTPRFPISWKEADSTQRSGYIDVKGNLVAEFPFHAITEARERLAFYTRGERWAKGLLWGLVREDGTPVTPTRFTSYRLFSEGRAAVSTDAESGFSFTFGYIDGGGGWAIAPQFEAAYPFSEGVAYAKRPPLSSLFGLIDLHGERLIDDLSIGGAVVREGLAQGYSAESRRFGFRTPKGEWAIPARYSGAYDFSGGMGGVLVGGAGREQLGFVARDGNMVIEPGAYRSAEGGFSEGLVGVYRRKKGESVGGFINRRGEEVIPCRWGLVRPFSEGRAAVMDAATRLWGYIDARGEVIIPLRFGAVEDFRAGLARARLKKIIGANDYIDTFGNVVWPAGKVPGKINPSRR